ncbi:MAG: hypothetical protein AAF333_02505 [Planctomycetota bacterium]
MKLVLGSFGILVFFVLPVHSGEAWTRITTAEGRGADATILLNDSHGEQSLLGLQQNAPAADVGQKIYLRFDLSRLVGRHIASAHLTLQPVSGYDGRYDFNVFGLDEAVDGSDVSWTESGSGTALTWANAPGHDPTNAGGPFEVNEIQEFAEVETEQQNDGVKIVKKKAGVRLEVMNNGGINVNAGTYLGKISVRPGNNRCRLVGEPLANFLNADRDGLATIVLTRATPAAQSTLFASAEHPLFDPPALWLSAQNQDNAMAGAEEIIGVKVPVKDAPETLGSQYRKLELKAHDTGWVDCIDEAEEIHARLNDRYGRDDPARATRLAVSLADLLQAEIAFKASDLLEDEWAERFTNILSQHPDRADDLIYAFYILAGTRLIFEPEPSLSFIDFQALLDSDLTPLARQTIMEFMVDVIDGPGPSEEGRLAHYQGLIPVAYGKPTTPHVMRQYAKELERAEGTDAVLSFLGQAAALKPDEPMGMAASVLRVSYEADPARKTALVSQIVESGEGEIVEILRPYYLTAQARSGLLLEALAEIDPGLSEKRLADPEAWGQAVVDRVYEVVGASKRIALFSQGDAGLDMGELGWPSELCVGLSNQLHKEGKHLDAAAVGLGLLKRLNVSTPSLELASSPGSLAQMMPQDSSLNRQAIASLLLHVIYKQLYQKSLSDRFLKDASAVSATGKTRAYVLFYQALAEAQGGKPDKVQPLLDEALALSPGSSALTELRGWLEDAGGL